MAGIKKVNEQMIEEMIKLYEQGYTSSQIGDRFNISRTTVATHLRKYIKLRTPKELTKEEELEIINLYKNEDYAINQIAKKINTTKEKVKGVLAPYRKGSINHKFPDKVQKCVDDYKAGKSMNEIANLHGISNQTVLNYLREYGVERRTMQKTKRKIEVNDLYFNEITNETAYVLGIVFACPTHRIFTQSVESKGIYFASMNHNVEILYEIKQYLSPDREITELKNNVSVLKIISNEITEDVIKYGFKTEFPNLDADKEKPFYKGYLKYKSKVISDGIYISTALYDKTNFLKYLESIDIELDEISIKKTAIVIRRNEQLERLVRVHYELLDRIIKYNNENTWIRKWENLVSRFR